MPLPATSRSRWARAAASIVAGGVCLRLGALFDRAAFRRRFVDKGRMRAFLEPIPTWLVLRGDTGLIGAAHYRLGD